MKRRECELQKTTAHWKHSTHGGKLRKHKNIVFSVFHHERRVQEQFKLETAIKIV